MWDKSLLLLIGAVALVAGQSNQYLPPKDAPTPKQDKNYLPPEQAPSQPDNQYLPSLEGEANQGVPSVRVPDQEEQEHPHHDDHDHHHEHWDLRESIPGEPGQDYPLHHAPPDTGFSCVGRTTGYYADIASGCQSFHVCSGDEFPPQSFLCPNGTIFNQKVFACEWWTDVDCKVSEEHYAKNSEIGIVPESNVQRKPVKQGSGLLSRPIVVAEPDNDINFQPDSSNDDGTLAYLPPKTDTRKPVVPEYNGPPPTNAPKRRPPARTQTEAPAYLPPREQSSQTVVISPTLPPGIVVQKYNNRPAPVQKTAVRTTQAPVQTKPVPIRTTEAPRRPTLAVQAENAYLPPLEITTQKPVVVRTQAPFRPPVQPQRAVVSKQEYVPPVTTARTTTQRVEPTSVQKAVNQQNSFTQTQQSNGYNYQKPIESFSQPTATQRPTTQRVSQEPTKARVTTERATFAPITQRIVSQQAFNSFNQIKQQSFSQQNGYNYEKPSIPFVQTTIAPTTQRVTQQPVTYTTPRQTSAPVTQRQQQTFNQNQFTQTKQQSFSQQNGYNYQKPSTQFVQTTAAPTTQRVTQAPVTYTTQRQTSAPVTQRQQQTFNQNQFTQTKQQSFSQQNGYNYQKPSTQFVQTTAAPTTQRVTQAPVTYTTQRQTSAPVTQRQQQTFNQNQFTQIKQQSFSQQNGYNYEKPSIPFVQTTKAPTTQRVTQQPVTYTTPRQTYAPVTQRQQQTFNQNQFTQTKQQSFSQQNGYNYQKPSTQFVPTTAAPTTQRVTQAPVTYTTQRQTSAPVTQRQQQTFNQNQFTQTKQQSFSQQNGYNYQKPSTQFVQTTAAPTTQRVTQAPVTYTTQRQTYAPVTQRQQQTFNQNQFTQIKQQSFSQQNGYNYEKPAIAFPAPTSRPTQAPIIYTTAKQTSAPVTQRQQSFNQNTFTQVKQSINQQNGYNYQKPVTSAPTTQRTTQAPITQRVTQTPFTYTTAKQTSAPVTQRVQSNQNTFTQVQQQVFNQQSGYQYQKPNVGFEQTMTFTKAQTVAPVVNTQTPARQSFAPVTQVNRQQTFGQSSNSGFSQIKQQSFSQTSGYTYEKPTVTFATQKTEEATTQRPTTLAPVTYTTVKQTSAPTTQRTPSANSYSQTISQNTGYTYDKQTTIPQQTYSQTDGYSYQKPAVSFNTASNSFGANLAQTVSQSFQKADEKSQIIDQAHIRINTLSQSQAKVAEEAPVVLNLGSGFTSHSKTSGSASSDGYSYNSFSHVAGGANQISGVQKTTEVSGDHAISVQENKHVVHDASLVKVTLPPCQHAKQPDPLDEIRSPVSFGPPAPFVAKASNTDEGYHYPKPNIPFITPNNPTLKQAQQGTQFGNQGLYTEVSFGGQHQQQQVNSHHESFIQAFNSASSSNTHSFNSGSFNSQQQQQQGRSAESLNHEFEIVPSISFSYQLNQKKRSADQNSAPVA